MKKSRRESAWSKAICLEKCWDTFVIEHPEIGFVFNKSGQIIDALFPPETKHILLILNMNIQKNNVVYLCYTYGNTTVRYEDSNF